MLLGACNSAEELETEHVGEEEVTTLLIKDILASNDAVKIGTLQTKVVEQTVHSTGRIEVPPTELISVHSKSKGFVENMKYLPGDYVKKGALLFTVFNPDLVEKQRILLETKAELSLAEKDFDRKSSLQAENATTQKSFDEALAKKELLSAKYKGLKNELQLLGINLTSLEKEQKFQSKLFIHAIQSGYVHEVLVNKGQMIEPQNKLMEIANDAHIHLELQVLSKDVPLLEKKQEVQFTLANNPQKFSATVVKLNPVLDHETGTLRVHCHINDEQSKQMRAGMFVNAAIKVEAQEMKGLPLEAVIKEGENYFAYFAKGSLLEKQLLKNVRVSDNFVMFDNNLSNEMVIAGAYYVE